VFIVFVFSRSVIRARVAPCSDSDADSERIRACRHAGRRGKKEPLIPLPWTLVCFMGARALASCILALVGLGSVTGELARAVKSR